MINKRAFGWMLFIGFTFLLLVCERVESTRSGLAMSRTERAIKIKEARNEHMHFQLAELMSPAQLELAAKSRGMTSPEPDSVTTLADLPASNGANRWLAKLMPAKENTFHQ